MKITVTGVAPKSTTRVIFDEKIHASFFREKGGQQEIVLKVSKKEELTRRKWFLLVREVVALAQKHHLAQVVVAWDDLVRYPILKKDTTEMLATLVAENFALAGYTFARYKKKDKESYHGLKQVILAVTSKDLSAVKKGVARGLVHGEYLNWYRDLANIPCIS